MSNDYGLLSAGIYSECFGMIANGRPNPYYQVFQHSYPGIRYISPYATPNTIMQYQPFIELNKCSRMGGYKGYTPEEMARQFRQYPLEGKNRNNYMRSKM